MQKLLTPRDIANLINCRPSTIYAWAKCGAIPAKKINGLVRFDATEIEQWLSKQNVQSLDTKVNQILRK